MLLERAAGLADKIGQYGKLKLPPTRPTVFRTRADQIGQAAALLMQARATLQRFRAAGVPVDFHPLNAVDLSGKATTLRAIVAQNPAKLADPPVNLKYDFADRLTSLAIAANGAISDGWRSYVAANGPGGHDDILNALGELPQMRTGVNGFVGYRQKAAALASSLPTDPSVAVADLKTLVRGA